MSAAQAGIYPAEEQPSVKGPRDPGGQEAPYEQIGLL